MSQVDDWSDGYTSDYLRDLNTYGPASANAPRPSVVSHQMRYQSPVVQTEARTNDTPMYTENDARGAYAAPASGYRAPAGGGWDVNSSDTNLRFSNESGGKQYRVSRTQTAKKTAKKTVKKQAQAEYHTGGALTQDESNVAERAASHRQSDFDWGELNGQALDAAARFLPVLRLLSGFGVGAGAEQSSTDIPETNFNRGLMGGVGSQAEAIRKPAPESSSLEGQFKNMPWYEDAKAHHEAVKKNMDDYGSALGTLKSTWDDIPWWTKLVMLPSVFKAGSPAAGASTTGNAWTEAAAEGRRLYGPVAERLLAPKGPLSGGARTTLTSADEGLPVGYTLLRNPKIDTSPLAGQTSNLVQQLRAAGIPEDQIAASIARINAGAAGREAAAAGREAAAAGGQAAGRETVAAGEQAAGRDAAAGGQAAADEAAAAGGQAAGAGRAGEAAADGGVSELANAGSAGRGSADEAMELAAGIDGLIRRIESGAVDEMDKAWIKALADQKAAGFESEYINYVLDAARAAGVIK